MEQDCIFCRIAAGDLPARIVRETDDVVVFRDINAQAPVHVLAIPRRHIPSVNALEATDAELIGQLFLAAKECMREEGMAERGYRLVMNTGVEGGQAVDHIHLHVMAGRSMRWPPG